MDTHESGGQGARRADRRTAGWTPRSWCTGWRRWPGSCGWSTRYLPDGDLVAAHTLVERAGSRLALSRDHTVVALAGSTGSGKSSLFNALARLKLSPVGVRRPTTGVAHACVWGPLEPANRLLDWVGVLPRQRFVRESALDGDDEAALRGLVLLDLPDFDSVERGHRLEVDRLLGLVDQVVWVVDPQKYGDRILHQAYLSQFQLARRTSPSWCSTRPTGCHPGDTEVVLDRPAAAARRGRAGRGAGAGHLGQAARHADRAARRRWRRTVADRQAALRRLAGDLDAVGEQLADMIGPPAAEDEVDRATVRQLADALAASAGVPAVADATAGAVPASGRRLDRLAAGPRAAPAAARPAAPAAPRPSASRPTRCPPTSCRAPRCRRPTPRRSRRSGLSRPRGRRPGPPRRCPRSGRRR